MQPLGPKTSFGGAASPVIGSTYGTSIYGVASYGLSGGGSTGGTTYSAQQVYAIMCGSARETWTFDWLSPDFRYLGDLSRYVLTEPGPQITHDATSNAIKRTLTFASLSGLGLDPFRDLVRVRYQLQAPDGGWLDWTVGTFLASPPKKSVSEDTTVLSYSCADLLDILNKDEHLYAYTVKAGANHTAAVRTLVSGSTPTPLACLFPDPARTLPADLVWDAGASKLTTVNDLLTAIAFSSAWTDELGRLRSAQFPDYNREPPAWVWDTTQPSVVISDPLSDEGSDMEGWNVFRVIGQDPRNPNNPPSAVYENFTDSPIGTNRGRKRVKVIQDSKIADSSAAYARARAEAQASARAALGLVTVSTLAWPVSQDRDVYRLTYRTPDEGLQDWRYLELGWTMACVPGGATTHKLQRIVLTQ